MSKHIKQFKLGNLVGIIGYANKDAEISAIQSGSKVCKFDLIIGKDETREQGKQNVFASCAAWEDLAVYASSIKKGDTVFVIGTTSTRDYKGKNYTTLTADWLNVVKEVTARPQQPRTQAPTPTATATSEDTSPNLSTDDFEEIDTSESELPF